MSRVRVLQRAVVHPLQGAPFRPHADVSFRDNRELSTQLTTYLRRFYPGMKIVIDTTARKVLVDGEERASYVLVAPHHPSRTNPLEVLR